MSNSISSNQPGGLPGSAISSNAEGATASPTSTTLGLVPPVLLDQVDHLSALPPEIKLQIIDWLTPMQRLTADLVALATVSRKTDEVVKIFREMHGSDLKTVALRRYEAAFTFLSNLANDERGIHSYKA